MIYLIVLLSFRMLITQLIDINNNIIDKIFKNVNNNQYSYVMKNNGSVWKLSKIKLEKPINIPYSKLKESNNTLKIKIEKLNILPKPNINKVKGYNSLFSKELDNIFDQKIDLCLYGNKCLYFSKNKISSEKNYINKIYDDINEPSSINRLHKLLISCYEKIHKLENEILEIEIEILEISSKKNYINKIYNDINVSSSLNTSEVIKINKLHKKQLANCYEKEHKLENKILRIMYLHII